MISSPNSWCVCLVCARESLDFCYECLCRVLLTGSQDPVFIERPLFNTARVLPTVAWLDGAYLVEIFYYVCLWYLRRVEPYPCKKKKRKEKSWCKTSQEKAHTCSATCKEPYYMQIRDKGSDKGDMHLK